MSWVTFGAEVGVSVIAMTASWVLLYGPAAIQTDWRRDTGIIELSLAASELR